MRPIALIFGIILGSSTAITLGLAVVLLIYLLIGGEEPSMQREIPALTVNTLVFLVFTGLSATAFHAEVLRKRWVWITRSVLVGALTLVIYYYLP